MIDECFDTDCSALVLMSVGMVGIMIRREKNRMKNNGADKDDERLRMKKSMCLHLFWQLLSNNHNVQ